MKHLLLACFIVALPFQLSLALAETESVNATDSSDAPTDAVLEKRRQQLREGATPASGNENAPSADLSSESSQSEDLASPDAPPGNFMDDANVRANYSLSLIKYYEYRRQGYIHRMKVFNWQFLSSKIIFFVVISLVFVGVYFAAIQFHSGKKFSTAENTTTTEVELSIQGVKVRSPVLGVIILALSLGFFYLYLTFVYPIQNIF